MATTKKLIHHLEMSTAFIFYTSLYLATRVSWELGCSSFSEEKKNIEIYFAQSVV